MPFAEYIYGATALIVLAELVSGRWKGVATGGNVLVFFGCIAGRAMLAPLAAMMVAAVLAFGIPAWEGALSQTPVWLAWLGVLTVGEFCFYWVHRWAHEVRNKPGDWLWKLHRTHHAGKFMNVALTLRINVFWYFVVPYTFTNGIALYLGLGQGVALSMVTVYGWNLITHANFRWDDPIRRHPLFGQAFRALEHIVVSPGIHHSHHGYGKDGHSYGNYAVTFSWLDWMFGTLHIPEGRPWRYGLPGPMPWWAEEIAYPLVRARRSEREAPASAVPAE